MAWSQDVPNSTHHYAIWTESLTLPSAASTDVNSSVMLPGLQFHPARDILVIANTAETDLTADGGVDVEGSFDGGTTWVKLHTDLIGSIDNTVAHGLFDVSAKGTLPQLRLTVTSDANQAGETLIVALVVPPAQPPS